jgi:hypothetical protein
MNNSNSEIQQELYLMLLVAAGIWIVTFSLHVTNLHVIAIGWNVCCHVLLFGFILGRRQ